MCRLLTGQDFKCEGVLLPDGVCKEEASVAAVVSLSIFGQNVREVQVPIQTHGHSLILRDRNHSWKTQEDNRGVKDLRPNIFSEESPWMSNESIVGKIIVDDFEVKVSLYFMGP